MAINHCPLTFFKWLLIDVLSYQRLTERTALFDALRSRPDLSPAVRQSVRLVSTQAVLPAQLPAQDLQHHRWAQPFFFEFFIQFNSKYGPRATVRPATHYIRTARDKLVGGPRAVLSRHKKIIGKIIKMKLLSVYELIYMILDDYCCIIIMMKWE